VSGKKGAPIKQVKTKGLKVKRKFFNAFFIFQGPFKYCVLASKKGVSKKAVIRNRARRRVKAAFQIFFTSHELPLSMVIQVHQNALSCPWEDLLKDVEDTFLFMRERCKE